MGKQILVPKEDYLILEFVEKQEKSGIVLPDSIEKEKEEDAVFKVVAAGDGYYDNGTFISNAVNLGDFVIVGAYGLSKFKFEGKKVIIARGRDVMFTIEEV